MSYSDRFGPNGPPPNYFQTHDAQELTTVQGVASDYRQWELQHGRAVVRGEFDADHFRRVHAFVMQDVYPWAGQTRQDQQSDASRDRASEATGNPLVFEKANVVNDRLDEIASQLKSENYLRGLDQEDFVKRLGAYYDRYNHVAPFRGGNEATLNAITEQIAKNAGYQVNLSNAPLLRHEADVSLEAGPFQGRAGLEASLAPIVHPAFGPEAELLRRPSLREPEAAPTRRSHEVDNQRELRQAGMMMEEKMGGRAGDRPEQQLFRQSVEEIASGTITDQNLRVVRQLGDSIKGRGHDAPIARFEQATANLAELKGFYLEPQSQPSIARLAPAHSRTVSSEAER